MGEHPVTVPLTDCDESIYLGDATNCVTQTPDRSQAFAQARLEFLYELKIVNTVE